MSHYGQIRSFARILQALGPSAKDTTTEGAKMKAHKKIKRKRQAASRRGKNAAKQRVDIRIHDHIYSVVCEKRNVNKP